MRYYKNLDGLRAIAAITVFFNHFAPTYKHSIYQNNKVLQVLFEQFQHGVTLFFVLSGFVITRILINTKNNDDYFRRFYYRRILRIFPLYYLYLFFHFFVLYPLINGYSPPFLHQLPTYLYLQNFDIFGWFTVNSPGHYWTLAVEEHFYLFWPLLIFFVNKKNFKYIFIILFVSIMILKYVMHTNGYFISQFTFTRMDQLMMGGVLAFMEFNKFFNKPSNFKLISVLGIFFVLLLGAFFVNFTQDSTIMWVSKHTLIGLVLFSFIGVLLFESKLNLINTILESRIFQYFGKISYGFYVWHFFCIKLLFHFCNFNYFILDFILTFTFSTILAHISFHYFETYFLRLKDKKFT